MKRNQLTSLDDCVQCLGRIGFRSGERMMREYAARRERNEIPDTLLLCEHRSVYTIGSNADPADVLHDPGELERRGVEVAQTDRGGKVTWHGPGQQVGYVIADLRRRDRDLHRFCRALEEIMIRTLADFDIPATRIEGLTGVWVDGRKIGALGIRIRRWISTHGFCLNVDPDLSVYEGIVPCGIRDREVTSMAQELRSPVSPEEVRGSLGKHFQEIFLGG